MAELDRIHSHQRCDANGIKYNPVESHHIISLNFFVSLN